MILYRFTHILVRRRQICALLTIEVNGTQLNFVRFALTGPAILRLLSQQQKLKKKKNGEKKRQFLNLWLSIQIESLAIYCVDGGGDGTTPAKNLGCIVLGAIASNSST